MPKPSSDQRIAAGSARAAAERPALGSAADRGMDRIMEEQQDVQEALQ